MNKAQLMQRRHQTTLDNLYLAGHIAKKYAGKLDLDTLFSIADLELFQCTKTFDANYEGKKRNLGTYLGKPLETEIRREIVRQRSMGMTKLPENLADEYMNIKNAEISLWYELKRPPKDEEILDYLRNQARLKESECAITPKHIQAYRMITNGKVALSITSVYERQNVYRYHQLEKLVSQEDVEKMIGLLDNGLLTKNEKTAIKLYYGLGYKKHKYGGELTYQEIGAVLKIRKQRAKQLVDAALLKLKDKMTLEQIDKD